MKRPSFAVLTIVSGLLTVLFGAFAVASWRAYQARGMQFMPLRRGSGVATLDHTAGLAALAFVAGLVCVTSLISFVSSHDAPDTTDSRDPDADVEDGTAWTCAGCSERNPGNFDECWKCQRNRPGKNHKVP